MYVYMYVCVTCCLVALIISCSEEGGLVLVVALSCMGRGCDHLEPVLAGSWLPCMGRGSDHLEPGRSWRFFQDSGRLSGEFDRLWEALEGSWKLLGKHLIAFAPLGLGMLTKHSACQQNTASWSPSTMPVDKV